MFTHGLAPQYVATMGSVQPPPPPNIPPGTGVSAAVVIDGTPLRVVVVALAAAAGLTALKMGGFRFNVGVSN